MARGNTTEDLSTLQMALVGYQIEKQRIEEKIQEIQARLKGKVVPAGAGRAEACRNQAGIESGCSQTHRGGTEEALGRAPQTRRAGGQGSIDTGVRLGRCQPAWVAPGAMKSHS